MHLKPLKATQTGQNRAGQEASCVGTYRSMPCHVDDVLVFALPNLPECQTCHAGQACVCWRKPRMYECGWNQKVTIPLHYYEYTTTTPSAEVFSGLFVQISLFFKMSSRSRRNERAMFPPRQRNRDEIGDGRWNWPCRPAWTGLARY